MNKVITFAGKIVMGVCIYGIYRKTYDWGVDYIEEDIATIVDFGKRITNKIHQKHEA